MQKYHSIIDVITGLLMAFVIICVFNASNLYKWSHGLKISKFNQRVEKVTLKNWKQMHSMHLDYPQFTLENLWMEFRDAHKLLFPKTLEQVLAKRHNKNNKNNKNNKSKSKSESRKQSKVALAAKRLKTHKIAKLTPSVLLIGDSMMVSLAPTLKKKLSILGGEVDVDARVSTGLARPDVYNWPRAIRRKASTGRFDYIVLVIGTNDGQDFVKKGQILPYGTKEWVKEYQSRIRKMSEITCEAAKKNVMWLGLPPMRQPSFNRKIARLNSWIRKQISKNDCIEYVDLNGLYGDTDGSYIAYKKILNKLQKIRTSDGIHITKIGGNLISEKIGKKIILNERNKR